jgi:hypothetical protein
MSNVKPMVGQVWGLLYADGSHYEKRSISRLSNSRVLYTDGCGVERWSNRSKFIEDYEFIPQNDLEWLAVNEPEWNNDYFLFIAKVKGDRAYYRQLHVLSYARQQWQNMRYELGLDEPKNKTTWADCPFPTININCPCTLTPLKKETKMIDLRTAKVGDEFVDKNSNIVELVIADHSVSRYVGKGVGACGGKVFYGIYTNEGCNVDQRSCGLASKHEPRHWLKDLPNTDLFSLYKANYIYCDKTFGWKSVSHSQMTLDLDDELMPTLTGDEWKLSKISIVELRAWQEQNK